MNIIINGLSTYYDVKSSENMTNIWLDVTKNISEHHEFIQSIEIDGNLYDNGHFDILIKQFDVIHTVKIVTISGEKSFYTILEDLHEYAVKVLEEMENYIKPLYSGSIQNCDELPIIVESIEWIITSTTYLQYTSGLASLKQELCKQIDDIVNKYSKILEMLTSELEWGNLIGFADIVQYEFIPLLEEFYHATREVGRSERDILQ